jgi:hypothetical protein
MTFIRKPFLPWCNWRDYSCVTMMFLILKGCAELVSLPQRLEFTSLLFSGKSLGFFNHAGNFRAWCYQSFATFVWEWPQIQFLVHTVQPSRGSGIPASRSSCSFFAHFGIAGLYPLGPTLCLNLFFTFSSFILLLRATACGVVCCYTNVSHSFGMIYPNWFSGDSPLCT